jgi:hypothetical protein
MKQYDSDKRHHRLRSITKREISVGETPGIREACPIECGLIFLSFSLLSLDNDVNVS